MPACNAPACPRAATCARHGPDAKRAVDYSHGHWFDPWHCFFFDALPSTTEARRNQKDYRVRAVKDDTP